MLLSSALRSRRHVVGTLAGLTMVAGALAGCGSTDAPQPRSTTPVPSTTASPLPSTTASSVSAVAQSARLAKVDSQWLCAVSTTAYPSQDAITADLDTRLGALGLTHASWATWRSAVAGSPKLRAELAKFSAADC